MFGGRWLCGGKWKGVKYLGLRNGKKRGVGVDNRMGDCKCVKPLCGMRNDEILQDGTKLYITTETQILKSWILSYLRLVYTQHE